MPQARAETRRDLEIGAGIFASLFVLYWADHCRTFGPGDSPQHVLSAVTWSVSVAPGYPLYNLCGYLFSRLPLSTPMSLVNAFSGLCHALAAAGFFLILRGQGLKRLPAAIATALLALSRLYWYYSEIAEVRALNDLLAVGAALALVALTRGKRPAMLFVLGAILGLGLSHHPTFVLILPAAAYWFWAEKSWPRGWRLAIFAGCAAASCALPYLALWLRLQSSAAVWNPAETKTLADIWALFTRQTVGGPLRMVVGTGVFGFGTFDSARFFQHLGWFFSACWTDLTPAGLLLAAAGIISLWRRDRHVLIFWSLWIFLAALTFIAISSQQLILCDTDYVRGMVLRFYLLPYIGLIALAGFGAGWILEKVRPAFGWALLAGAIMIPVLVRPMNLRDHDTLMDYCRLMVKSTGPRDMIILAPDDTILAMSYLELSENATGDRVLLVPSLFGYPPYIRRLHARHPDLALPLENRQLSTDWSLWLKRNPGRRLFSEAVNRDTLLERVPNSVPHGVLGEVLIKPRKSDAGADAKQFLAMTPDDFITRWGIMDFTQEVYLTRTYRMLLEWYGSRLGPKDEETALRLRARLEAL